MTGERELFGILKDVSRSFYISVRFLPKKIRLTIALGYLLARASDTIADSNCTAPQLRSAFLAQFLKQIRAGDSNTLLDLTLFWTSRQTVRKRLCCFVSMLLSDL